MAAAEVMQVLPGPLVAIDQRQVSFASDRSGQADSERVHRKLQRPIVRDECLNQHHFLGLNDARGLIEGWRSDYNRLRPHTSLGGTSPEEFISSLAGRMRPARLKPHRQLNLFDENPASSELS